MAGPLPARIRTPERAPSEHAWERGGAQTKLFDKKVLVEGELPSLQNHNTYFVNNERLTPILGLELLGYRRKYFASTCV